MIKRLWRDQAGSSFVMTMVGVAVVASALAIMLSSFGTSSAGTLLIHRRVNAQTLVRQQIESVKAELYQPDPIAVPYTLLSAPSGYTITVSVSYWVSGTQTFVPTAQAEDDGLQLIEATVWTTDGEKVFGAQDIKRR